MRRQGAQNVIEIDTKEYLEQRMQQIEGKIEDVKERFDEKIDGLSENIYTKLDVILKVQEQTLEQAKKTNGRVNKHDEILNELEKKHYSCPGAKAIEEIKSDNHEGRILSLEENTEIIKFINKHPKITKFVGIALVVLFLFAAANFSIETLDSVIKILK